MWFEAFLGGYYGPIIIQNASPCMITVQAGSIRGRYSWRCWIQQRWIHLRQVRAIFGVTTFNNTNKFFNELSIKLFSSVCSPIMLEITLLLKYFRKQKWLSSPHHVLLPSVPNITIPLYYLIFITFYIQVSSEERQQAKQICYGIIYGQGVSSLADKLNVTESEASDFIVEFRKAYPSKCFLFL